MKLLVTSLIFLLFLQLGIEKVRGLRVDRLDSAVVELEYYGGLNVLGNCTNLIPNKSLLKCELGRESTYIQIRNTSDKPMLKIRSYSNSQNQNNITGTFIGASCQRLIVNAFRSYKGRDKYLTFSSFGDIPPLDNNTLQVEFVLQYVFY